MIIEQPQIGEGFYAPGSGLEPVYPESWKGVAAEYCPMLGRQGNTLRDWSGRGKHGTLTSMDAASDYVPSNVRGQSGCALAFDGGYITVPSSQDIAALPATYNFSVNVWCRSRANSVDRAAVSFDGAGNDGILVIYPNDNAAGSGGCRVYWGGLGGNIINESGPDLSNEWHMTTFVSYASGDHRAYRDGVVVATSTATGNAGSASRILMASFAGGQKLTGDIAGLTVFNRALSVGEIQAKYQVGPLGPYQFRLPGSAYLSVGGGGGFNPAWAVNRTVLSGVNCA